MTVLGTKLHLPSPRRRLVQRARITDQLRAGAGEGPRLVLVAAPAGFGKTTLLAQWLSAEGSQRRVAWLALDAGDADLRLFLTHLVAAISWLEAEVANHAGAFSRRLTRDAGADRSSRDGSARGCSVGSGR